MTWIKNNSASIFKKIVEGKVHSGKLYNIAGWKMDLDWVDVFPIEHGDFPASYVSFQGGNPNLSKGTYPLHTVHSSPSPTELSGNLGKSSA